MTCPKLLCWSRAGTAERVSQRQGPSLASLLHLNLPLWCPFMESLPAGDTHTHTHSSTFPKHLFFKEGNQDPRRRAHLS